MIDNDVDFLFQISMRLLMKNEAKTHGSFFTQSEFENNMATIFRITGAVRKLEQKLKSIEINKK